MTKRRRRRRWSRRWRKINTREGGGGGSREKRRTRTPKRSWRSKTRHRHRTDSSTGIFPQPEFCATFCFLGEIGGFLKSAGRKGGRGGGRSRSRSWRNMRIKGGWTRRRSMSNSSILWEEKSMRVKDDAAAAWAHDRTLSHKSTQRQSHSYILIHKHQHQLQLS